MQSAQFLMALGGILLLGLLTDALGRRTFLPRVTLLIIFGVLIGKEVLDFIPTVITDRFELITNMALIMIGFLLGGRLSGDFLKKSARAVLWISLLAPIITILFVMLGLWLMNVPLGIAILLGCIASATAPAATVDVVLETNCNSSFSKLLLSIVALDDLWALILFSIGMAVVANMNGTAQSNSPLLMVVHEIGGAILVGIIVGVPAAYLTGRIRLGQPMLTEALGVMFLCGGLAMYVGVSFLIASMVTGIIVANFAKHHEYPFHEIEGIEAPFLSIFFVLAGASIEVEAVKTVGIAVFMYIVCRSLGKIFGATIGAGISGVDPLVRRWIGVALLPQAGVAIGMSLLAANQFPEYRQTILSVAISATIFFELIGPVLTRLAITQTKST